MAKSDFLVGIEIGTTKVCVAVAEVLRSQELRIIGIGEAPSRGLRKGEITDFDIAQACVREALADAEAKANIEIHVADCIGITGTHIASFNNRGVITLPEGEDEVTEEDCAAVQAHARDANLPAQSYIIHDILQQYYIDGAGHIAPLGLSGSKLEADYHIIHGVKSRVQNTIKCVAEVLQSVESFAFTGYAAAQAVLTPEQKQAGAIVIDMGGGTTDYVAYVEGTLRASGVLGVGGDHIDNDLSCGLRIPINRAKKLKIDEGSVLLGNSLPGETITLKDDSGFAGKEVERETLNGIIHLRVREAFEKLRIRFDDAHVTDIAAAGVFLTGGCSELRGIQSLAEEIFELPVTLTRARDLAGITSAFENPQYSAAIGLVRYAQAERMAEPEGGLFSKLRSVFGRMRLF